MGFWWDPTEPSGHLRVISLQIPGALRCHSTTTCQLVRTADSEELDSAAEDVYCSVHGRPSPCKLWIFVCEVHSGLPTCGCVPPVSIPSTQSTPVVEPSTFHQNPQRHCALRLTALGWKSISVPHAPVLLDAPVLLENVPWSTYTSQVASLP